MHYKQMNPELVKDDGIVLEYIDHLDEPPSMFQNEMLIYDNDK